MMFLQLFLLLVVGSVTSTTAQSPPFPIAAQQCYVGPDSPNPDSWFVNDEIEIKQDGHFVINRTWQEVSRLFLLNLDDNVCF